VTSIPSAKHRSGRHPGRWRGMALLPAGAFAVHQLRVLLELGSAHDAPGAAHGHLYLPSLLTWVTIALAAALGGLIAHVARAWPRGGASEQTAARSTSSLWAAVAASLLGLHALHEGLEGLLLGGPGLSGLAGAGGLCALVAAIVIGGLIALALRGARSLIARVARRPRARADHASAAPRLPHPRSVTRRLTAPLARSAAGRAPPRRSSLAA
jgi:hypothetical protein